MNTPDITKAQIGAFITGALGLGASFGFKLSEPHTIEVMSLTGVLAVGLMYADKEIRKGRAMASAAHLGGYSVKTAIEDAVLGVPTPAPAAPAAPVADAPAPIVADAPPAQPAAPAPATIGQPAA